MGEDGTLRMGEKHGRHEFVHEGRMMAKLQIRHRSLGLVSLLTSILLMRIPLETLTHIHTSSEWKYGVRVYFVIRKVPLLFLFLHRHRSF